MENEDYGKTPENPIRIKGVPESIEFLNSLVTDDYLPFVYHRLKSIQLIDSKPIDCYEIQRDDYNKDLLYIDTYTDNKHPEPPEGYLQTILPIASQTIMGFEIKYTHGVNYKLNDFPYDLFNI